MSGLSIGDDGENIEFVLPTSSSTAVTSKQSHTSAQFPSLPMNLASCEAAQDHATATPASHSRSLTTQPQQHLQTSLISPYTSAPVTLVVGGPASPSREREPVTFYVHADLLTSTSPFFRAAFGSGTWCSSVSYGGYDFQESLTRAMTLPEERPDDIRYLLQWVYWKAAMSTTSQTAPTSTSGPSSPPNSTQPVCLSASTRSTCTSLSSRPDNIAVGALWHCLIDPRLDALSKYDAKRHVVSSAAAHGETVQTSMPTPTPPTFGPLVRLWLLAGKLDVRGGLMDDIVDRVLEVARVGNCVPAREDVWMLWEGTNSSGQLRGKLRHLILDLYVGMRCGSLFVGKRDLDWNGECQWHGGFLQDLVRRLMGEVHGVWDAKDTSSSTGTTIQEWKSRARAEAGSSSSGTETAGKTKQGKKSAGDADSEADAEGEFVMVGRLRMRRSAYHEHAQAPHPHCRPSTPSVL